MWLWYVMMLEIDNLNPSCFIRCDYGKWNMSRLSVYMDIGPHYVQASLIPQNLKSDSKDLYEGINVKRAYKCIKEDHSNTTIHLDKITVLDTRNDSEIHPGNWKAEIQFQVIQVQPFLVFKTYFDDPYLCRWVLKWMRHFWPWPYCNIVDVPN